MTESTQHSTPQRTNPRLASGPVGTHDGALDGVPTPVALPVKGGEPSAAVGVGISAPVRVEPVSVIGSSPDPSTPAATPRTDQPSTRVIALVNQKGGVGKTTTTVSLGSALAAMGKRVLLIDLDPQAHLTLHLGVEPDGLERSVYDLLTDPDVSAQSIAHAVGPNMTVLPAEVNLAGVEPQLAPLAASGRAQRVLLEKCQPLLSRGGGGQGFDFVLIDCPPSLGLLTLNALALASEVIVPMQAHFLALQGLSKLLETVALVNQTINPKLAVCGVVLCMHESQTLLAGEVLADLRAFLDAARTQDVPWRDAVVFGPPIRRNIKLAECPSFGKTIFDYAPGCPGANDYQSLAQAVVGRAASASPGRV